MAAIDTSEVIKLLREFGQRVALRGGNPYRAKAYARAAESNTQPSVTEEARAILFGQTAAHLSRAAAK